MKKALVIASVATLCLAPAVQAAAQSSRLYFAGYLGLNTFTDRAFSDSATPASGQIGMSNAPMFAGALGVRLNRNVRIEAEASYRKSEFSQIKPAGGSERSVGGDVKTWAYMLNGYYDFDLGWKNIQPFVTAGLGLAHHDGQIDDLSGVTRDVSGSDWALAYQVGTGLTYRVRDNLAFTGGYRFFGTTDIGLENTNIKYTNHELRLGVQYDLGP